MDGRFGHSCVRFTRIRHSAGPARGHDQVDSAIVFAGCLKTGASADLLLLDLDTQATIPLARDGPSARYSHGAAVIGQRHYVFGGCTGEYRALDDLYVLKVGPEDDYLWEQVPRPPAGPDGAAAWPHARFGHSMVAVGSKLVVFGGFTPDRRALEDLCVFDTQSMDWSFPETAGDAPSGRAWHSSAFVLHNGTRFLCIFGGFLTGGVASNDLFLLDLDTLTWTQVFNHHRPPPRYSHSMVVFSGMLCLYGGHGEAGLLDDVWCYRLAAKQWLQAPARQRHAPRCSHACFVHRNQMFIHGGRGQSGPSSSIFALDIDTILASFSSKPQPPDRPRIVQRGSGSRSAHSPPRLSVSRSLPLVPVPTAPQDPRSPGKPAREVATPPPSEPASLAAMLSHQLDRIRLRWAQSRHKLGFSSGLLIGIVCGVLIGVWAGSRWSAPRAPAAPAAPAALKGPPPGRVPVHLPAHMRPAGPSDGGAFWEYARSIFFGRR